MPDDIWSTDKLALFLAFFIPGFIAVQVYSLFISTGERDFTKLLPDVVAYSAMHYALTGWTILVTHDMWRVVAAYFDVLVLPLLWSPVLIWLRNRELGKRIFSKRFIEYMIAPEPSPWDRLFADQAEHWIRIRMKSGEYVGGIMAKGSATSTYPNPEQIYIKEVWRCTEAGFIGPIKSTGGLLINGTEIMYLELYEGVERIHA